MDEGVANSNRGRTTLSNQISFLEKPNLRHVLKPKDDKAGRDTLAGLSLAAVLGYEKRLSPVKVSRTLFDIISDEESGSVHKGLVACTTNRRNWKSFKDRLRLRRASSTSFPISDISLDTFRLHISRPPAGDAIRIPVITSSSSTRNIADAGLAPEGKEDGSDSGNVVSLMRLLETDREEGMVGSAMVEGEEEKEEEEEEGGEYSCCVCMARHKGAAFIPCGHTFCRQCPRELWVSRGNCPLCNGFILEILDIF